MLTERNINPFDSVDSSVDKTYIDKIDKSNKSNKSNNKTKNKDKKDETKTDN